MVGKRYARNRGLERPGVPDRNAAPQFRGNELARRPFFAQRFAARGAATQALARELQPNQAFPRHGAPNNDAFRRGNGFEGHMFGDHRWRGREGRFRKFWAGGVFWPFLFGDYVSYAFWPTAYSDPFWAYGPDSILWGSLLPNSAYAEDVNAPAPQEGEAGQGQVSESYVQGPRRGRGTGERATGEQNTGEQMAAICSGFAPGIADLPLEQLERLIQPTPEQGAAFDELKAAAARASQILRSACPQETPATPVARLDAMEQRLAAMQQAVAIIRGPLEKLYAFLSDEQVQRLENAAAEPGAKDQPSMNIAQLCSGESGLTNVPEDAIAQAIKLTDEQRFDFDNLKEVSKRAGEELRTACPKEMPKSINARLEVAQKRVVALIQAIETIRPAMAVFYASLSDEQKATLNAQGGGSRSAER